MTINSTQLVDDGFKVINKITGARNENEKLILEYATQFTTAVLRFKNSDGIVISSLYGTSGF